jgi:hypothetical protein
MRTILAACLCFAFAACGSGSKGPEPDQSMSMYDFSTNLPVDFSSMSNDDLETHEPMDLAMCMPPQGASCPTTAGNCLGIGNPCGGTGQSACPTGLLCECGICVQIFKCTPGKGQCGKGATCCDTATTDFVAVCLPNQCIPSDCTVEPT